MEQASRDQEARQTSPDLAGRGSYIKYRSSNVKKKMRVSLPFFLTREPDRDWLKFVRSIEQVMEAGSINSIGYTLPIAVFGCLINIELPF